MDLLFFFGFGMGHVVGFEVFTTLSATMAAENIEAAMSCLSVWELGILSGV